LFLWGWSATFSFTKDVLFVMKVNEVRRGETVLRDASRSLPQMRKRTGGQKLFSHLKLKKRPFSQKLKDIKEELKETEEAREKRVATKEVRWRVTRYVSKS
jgi:uncharacterized protein YlxW (UPF0749 family)